MGRVRLQLVPHGVPNRLRLSAWGDLLLRTVPVPVPFGTKSNPARPCRDGTCTRHVNLKSRTNQKTGPSSAARSRVLRKRWSSAFRSLPAAPALPLPDTIPLPGSNSESRFPPRAAGLLPPDQCLISTSQTPVQTVQQAHSSSLSALNLRSFDRGKPKTSSSATHS